MFIIWKFNTANLDNNTIKKLEEGSGMKAADLENDDNKI